jgi:hypothetical protein
MVGRHNRAAQAAFVSSVQGMASVLKWTPADLAERPGHGPFGSIAKFARTVFRLMPSLTR